MGSSPEVWPLTELSAGGPGSLRLPGRVLTASYAAVASDSGQPLVFNSATPVTLTLPASVVSADWFIVVQNIGAGALTVARNGRTIDGAAADLALVQDQGCLIYTDGANYWTMRGVGGAGARAAGITIDGGTSVPSTGSKGYIQVPFAATILSWTLLADQTGSCQITVKKSNYTDFPPTTSIVASAPPTLSSARKNSSSTLTGWTTSIAEDDILEFVLDTVSTLHRVHLILKLEKA